MKPFIRHFDGNRLFWYFCSDVWSMYSDICHCRGTYVRFCLLNHINILWVGRILYFECLVTAAKVYSSPNSSKMFSLMVKVREISGVFSTFLLKNLEKNIIQISDWIPVVFTGSMILCIQPRLLREPDSQLVSIDFHGDRPSCISWRVCQRCWQRGTDEKESAMRGLQLTWHTEM